MTLVVRAHMGERTAKSRLWHAARTSVVMLAAAAAFPALAPGRAATRSLTVRVRFTGHMFRVPPAFLGLSVEPQELARYARTSAFDQVIRTLSPGHGRPLLLRVAGQTSDFAWWQTTGRRPPEGVIVLGNRWMGTLATFARRDRLQVMLAVNVAVHSPSMAARFITAADDALPPAALVGVEIGNEPDLYFKEPALTRQRLPGTSRSATREWTRSYGPLEYRRDYATYTQALIRKFPQLAFGAPDITSARLDWLTAPPLVGPLRPSFLAVHRYPLTTCWPRSSPNYPTVPMLLMPRTSAGLAGTVRAAAAYAHARRVQFEVTEMNSVSCGGNRGVADTFATALWAPDALFGMLAAGVDRVGWHLRPYLPNAPFRLTQGAIRPMPELYGLAVFAEIMRHATRRLQVRTSASAAGRFTVWAVADGRARATLLFTNKTRRTVNAIIPAGRGPAQIRTLSAPSVTTNSRVRYAGRTIGSDGRWHGREHLVTMRDRAGVFRVRVPAYAALTLTFRRQAIRAVPSARRRW